MRTLDNGGFEDVTHATRRSPRYTMQCFHAACEACRIAQEVDHGREAMTYDDVLKYIAP